MLKRAIWVMMAVVFSLVSVVGDASELKLNEAAAFVFGDRSAVVYYVDYNDVYEVRVIVGPNIAVEDPVVRHSARLASGENCIISIGGQGSQASMYVIEIAREEDALSVKAWNVKKHFAQNTSE